MKNYAILVVPFRPLKLLLIFQVSSTIFVACKMCLELQTFSLSNVRPGKVFKKSFVVFITLALFISCHLCAFFPFFLLVR